MHRFNDAFIHHDPDALAELVAEDCVIEHTNPAPNGSRHVGREACLAGLARGSPATRPRSSLPKRCSSQATARSCAGATPGETEESDSVRGVNLMRARGGKIVEAMGLKGA